MIDPRIFNAGPGAYYQPEMVALEQELLNAGLTVESADQALNEAMVISLTDWSRRTQRSRRRRAA